jgi:hypothetical protein
VLWLLVGAAFPGFAHGVGAIGGTVTDTTGLVLPGASVTLTSLEGTVGGNQETVTDQRGAFQFLRLVPGTYRVHAELSGFRPAELPRIMVDTDTTSRADLRLDVGALQEGVTVTGTAPLLDTNTAFKQTVIGREALEALPNRTDVWSMARIVPGIVMGNIDVGGSERFFQGIPAARGTTAENKTLIDGMDISSMNARGTTAMMYPDPFAFEQASIQLGAPSAEYSAGGVTYNMITRSGTNQFHGGAVFNGTTPALAKSQNYSPELYAQLLSSIPAKVRAANPDLQPNADIRDDEWAGWAARSFATRSGSRGPGAISGRTSTRSAITTPTAHRSSTTTPSGRPPPRCRGKSTRTRSYRTSTTCNTSCRDTARPAPAFSTATRRSTTGALNEPGEVHHGAPLDHGVRRHHNRLRADDYFNPQPGDRRRSRPTTGDAGQRRASRPTTSTCTIVSIRASLSWVKSTHDMKVGLEAQHNSVATPVWSTSGMRANFANGSPVSANTYVVAVTQEADGTSGGIGPAYTYVENVQSAFAQDKWSPFRKLTLNVGVRYERQRSYQPETCLAQNQFFTATRCFDTVTAPGFDNFAPRFNLVYDVNGDGRTAVKFTANRYLQPIASSIVSRLNPLAGGTNAGQATVVSDTRQWLPQARCGQVGVTGCEATATSSRR